MKSTPTPPAAPVRNVHYVLSTHWDREWYQTFQGFRQRLVHLLDRTLRDLKSGELRGPFTTDGQAIMLEDYLEVRPEREAEIRELVRSGQLNVGPWFVLPDEWLVSGEALVRNLELGRAIARRFGGTPSSAGFACDLFGHVSQLPQILHGFGIHNAMVWRGLEPRASALFWWEAPDGTRVLAYRFPRTAYCDYSWDVRRCHQHDKSFDRERADRDLEVNLAREAARSGQGPILLFDGGDHLEHDLDYYRALMARQAGPGFPYQIKHSTLDGFMAEVQGQAAQVTDTVRGELRETGARPSVEDQQWLIPGILSSRVWIKQANARCQALLCHWAEPFGAATRAFCGTEYPAGFLNVAWRWLMMNHPHDSICGCSIDAVHEDMKYRFAQAAQMAENAADESLLSLAAGIAGPIGEKEVRVVIANPLTRALDETIELTLQIPTDWGCFNEFFGFEVKPGFRLYSPDGQEMPYQRIAQDMNRSKVRPRPRHYPQVYRTNDVTVAVSLRIPALGYTTLLVREGEMAPKDEIVAAAMLPTRHPASAGLVTSERSMENEFLAVTIEPNGSLTLLDKRSGETYPRLLTFEDIADIGDGWYHGQAINDQAFASTAAQSDIALLANGPLIARFRVRTVLRVPAEFKFDRMIRAEAFTDLVINTTVTLSRGADRLELNTTVSNQARDHRLRVLFPTGAKAATYLADSAFDVVERPIALPADNAARRELAVEACPQQSWTAVADAKRGLAVVAPGLMETAVRDLPDRPLALTLFRATRRTVFTDGEPQGQLEGELVFHYWLVPVRGSVDRVSLSEAGIQLGAGLRNAQLPPAGMGGIFVPVPVTLPVAASFLAVDGGVVVTSVREKSGALEVRLFNPGTKATAAHCGFTGRPSHVPVPTWVERVDFEGEVLGQRSQVTGGRCRTSVGAKEIITLRFPA